MAMILTAGRRWRPDVPHESPTFGEALDVERLIQDPFPECVLVGGTAAVHGRHRVSYDVDSVMTDLRNRFPAVLQRLEEFAGWKTKRARPPALILGRFHGLDVGIRQLYRQAPARNGNP